MAPPAPWSSGGCWRRWSEGVLIVGSGSITHNLQEFRQNEAQGARYASEFVEWTRSALRRGEEAAIVAYLDQAPHALRAHPTPHHYLPLPFAFAAAPRRAAVRVIDGGGISYGVLAMDTCVFEPSA